MNENSLDVQSNLVRLCINPLDTAIVFILPIQFCQKNHLHTESPVPMILLYVDLTDCWNNAHKPELEIEQLPHIYQLPSCCVRKKQLVWFIAVLIKRVVIETTGVCDVTTSHLLGITMTS